MSESMVIAGVFLTRMMNGKNNCQVPGKKFEAALAAGWIGPMLIKICPLKSFVIPTIGDDEALCRGIGKVDGSISRFPVSDHTF